MIYKNNRPENATELRKLAEEIIREKADPSPETFATMTLEEIRQVCHELSVHQIELEMQNEELRRSQVEMETARMRYHGLFDLAPVAYCTLSQKGLILESNIAAAAQFGLSRGALLKQPIRRFIHKEDQDIHYLRWQQLFNSQESSRGSVQPIPEHTGMPLKYELRMVKNDGTIFWAHLMLAANKDADGKPVASIIITDITERKETEKALLLSERRFAVCSRIFRP
jgi:PAS domain S-box-containing protein